MLLSELKKDALMMLGALAAGETPSPWHDGQMTAAFNEVHAMLDGVGAAYFLVTDPIPDEVAGDVTALVAMQKINIFAPDSEIYSRIAAAASIALASIQIHVPIAEDQQIEESPDLEYF